MITYRSSRRDRDSAAVAARRQTFRSFDKWYLWQFPNAAWLNNISRQRQQASIYPSTLLLSSRAKVRGYWFLENRYWLIWISVWYTGKDWRVSSGALGTTDVVDPGRILRISFQWWLPWRKKKSWNVLLSNSQVALGRDSQQPRSEAFPLIEWTGSCIQITDSPC